jgi:hypothetical protein
LRSNILDLREFVVGSLRLGAVAMKVVHRRERFPSPSMGPSRGRAPRRAMMLDTVNSVVVGNDD